MAVNKKAENLPKNPKTDVPGPQLDIVTDSLESGVSFHDHYELTPEVLGVGMCGSVMKAVHRQTGREVAVKTQTLAKMKTADLMDLDREITIQSSIHHENVAQLEAVYWSEEKVVMVCEHLEGGDVCDDLIESGPICESKAALVIRQVLAAVEDLHGRGIVHRDIKPENIMYETVAQDRVKLIDFGLSAFWHKGMKPMKRICGTTSYLAPEVRKQRYTNKADLWSIGATTYTMITGEKLRCDTRAPILAGSPSFRQCSEEAQDFVTKVLSMSASSRPTASEALAHSWIRGGDGVCSAPAPAPAAACARPRPPQEEPPACAAPSGPVALFATRSAPAPAFPALLPTSSRASQWLTSTPSPSAPATTQRGAKEDNAKKSIWQRSALSMRFGMERAAALFAACRGRSKTTARVRPEMDMYAVVPPV